MQVGTYNRWEGYLSIVRYTGFELPNMFCFPKDVNLILIVEL